MSNRPYGVNLKQMIFKNRYPRTEECATKGLLLMAAGRYMQFLQTKYWLVILVFAVLVGCSVEAENELKSENTSLINQVHKLNIRISSLESKLDSLTKMNQYWFGDYEKQSFENSGITNIESLIDSSLRAKPELIPIDAILGGTMSFGQIQLLSSNWLVAEYDDGHIMGRALYSFEMDENNKVNFELITSKEDQ